MRVLGSEVEGLTVDRPEAHGHVDADAVLLADDGTVKVTGFLGTGSDSPADVAGLGALERRSSGQ